MSASSASTTFVKQAAQVLWLNLVFVWWTEGKRRAAQRLPSRLAHSPD